MIISVPVSVDSTKIATKLIKQNAFNRTGQVDFNKYGPKDGCGLIPYSEISIDNFILETVVPDCLVVRGKYVEAPAATTLLWNMLVDLFNVGTSTSAAAEQKDISTSISIPQNFIVLQTKIDLATRRR